MEGEITKIKDAMQIYEAIIHEQSIKVYQWNLI